MRFGSPVVAKSPNRVRPYCLKLFESYYGLAETNVPDTDRPGVKAGVARGPGAHFVIQGSPGVLGSWWF